MKSRAIRKPDFCIWMQKQPHSWSAHLFSLDRQSNHYTSWIRNFKPLAVLMLVHINFSLVWVAEWPSFEKVPPTRLTICSLCNLTICSLSYFPFWFWLSLHTCYFISVDVQPDLCRTRSWTLKTGFVMTRLNYGGSVCLSPLLISSLW